MTNREKYAKEILDVACNGGAIALVKGKIVSCRDAGDCRHCYFRTTKNGGRSCKETVKIWANKEYNEFKPCPFCSKTDSLVIESCVDLQDCKNYDKCDEEYSYRAVICSFNRGGCGASGGFAKTREEAIAKWNRRADNDNDD